jgi:hypothetical protein
MKGKKPEKIGLTDAQLAAKYDTGKPVDFEQAVKKMVKGSSTTAKGKGR